MSFIELGAARPPIFIFGTENSLNSARAQELKKLLESMKQSFLICATPQGLKKNFEKQKVNKFLLILMVQDKLPPPLTGWKAIISSLKVPATYVIISAHPILESVKNDLKAELVIEGNAPLELLKQYLTPLPAAMAPGMSTVMPIEGFPLPSSSEKKKITPPAPPPAPTAKAAITATVIDDASQELDAPDLLDGKLENLDMGDFSIASTPATPASSPSTSLTGTEMADMGDVSDLGLNFDAQIAQSLGESSQLDNFMPDSVLSNHNSLVLDLNPQEEDPLGVSEVHEEAPVEDLLAVHSSPGIALEAPVEDLGAMVDMDDLTSLSGPPKISDDKPEDTAESEALGEDAIAELTSINLDSDVPTQKVEEEPVFDDDLSNIGADVASSSVLADANIPDSATVQILKKYAGLKEKEIKEKDSTIETLKKQLRQVEDKVKKSDEQRRKVTLELEESVIKIRTLESHVEREKNSKNKLEQDHQEQLKDYKIRLENAEFQAKRLEKKLDDYREKIKNDIQQIRHRERELANRLELQKRDAEALIASKDERLLLQKREIDRLEFEIDSLRDRIVEDTQRSEERAQKLIRAVQSLKLAQGVLSGIDDEVLPSVASRKSNRDPSGEAA